MAQQAVQPKLYRSRDAHLAGVCAGIAEYYDFDAIVVRILAVLLTLSTFGLGIVAYLVLWLYLPLAPESTGLYDVTPEWAESSAFGELDCLGETDAAARTAGDGPALVARLAVAVVLMLVFMVVALNVTPILSGALWWQFWPLILLMVGLCLIVIPVGGKRETAWHAIGIVVASAGASLLPMSLGVVAWETVPYAFAQLWVFIVVAVVLFVLGFTRNVGSLTVAGSLCFAAFCLIMLLTYSIPGDADAIMLLMPDGSSYRLGFLGL